MAYTLNEPKQNRENLLKALRIDFCSIGVLNKKGIYSMDYNGVPLEF
jgi:hypothetical protein